MPASLGSPSCNDYGLEKSARLKGLSTRLFQPETFDLEVRLLSRIVSLLPQLASLVVNDTPPSLLHNQGALSRYASKLLSDLHLNLQYRSHKGGTRSATRMVLAAVRSAHLKSGPRSLEAYGVDGRLVDPPATLRRLGVQSFIQKLDLAALHEIKLHIIDMHEIDNYPVAAAGYTEALATATSLSSLSLSFNARHTDVLREFGIGQTPLLTQLVQTHQVFGCLSNLSLGQFDCFAEQLETFLCSLASTLRDLQLGNIRFSHREGTPDACLVEFLKTLKDRLTLKSITLDGEFSSGDTQGWRLRRTRFGSRADMFSSSILNALEQWILEGSEYDWDCPIIALSRVLYTSTSYFRGDWSFQARKSTEDEHPGLDYGDLW